MITVYGGGDDLIEVDGDIVEEFSHYEAEDREVPGSLLAFSDGTVLRIALTPPGVWRITPVAVGRAALSIAQAPEDDDDNYSDRATLDGEIAWVVHGLDHALKAPRKAAGHSPVVPPYGSWERAAYDVRVGSGGIAL